MMRSLAKNYFLNLLYQVLIVILPLITAPYLARVLGADRIGEYSFAQSIVSYFMLFAAMGTALYGQRQVAACHARGENKKQIFAEIVLLRIIGAAAALGIYLAVICRGAENKLLYLVAAIEILAVAFDISWFYQGIEQFGNITLCNGLSKLLGVVGIFLFVNSREDLEVYVAFYCGAMLLGNVSQWIFLPPCLRGERLGKPRIRQHLMPTLSLFVSQFAIQAYTVLDKTMIGLITDSDFENGYYEQAQKLIKALTAVVTSIGAVMASRIAIVWNAGEEGKAAKVQELLLFSFRLVFALSLPIAAGTMVIASRFVPIFFGDGYGPVVLLIQVLAVIVPVIGCSNIIGIQLFVPSGREHLLTRSVMVGAGANVVLNLILIGRFGALGAAAASVLAELVVTGIQMYCARRDIRLKAVLRLFGRYLLFTAGVGCAGSLVAAYASSDIYGMLMIIGICVIGYGGFLLAIRDPVLKLFSK